MKTKKPASYLVHLENVTQEPQEIQKKKLILVVGLTTAISKKKKIREENPCTKMCFF